MGEEGVRAIMEEIEQIVSPYDSPAAETLQKVEDLAPIDLRVRFHREEMAVLAVGWFYYFMGSLVASLAVVLIINYADLGIANVYSVFFIAGAGVILAAMYLITGFGLRRFDSWARLPSICVAVVSIVIIPVGIVASAACIYLLCKNAVKEIFTPQYQTAVVAEGEIIGHYGWLAVLGGMLTALILSAFMYLISLEQFLQQISHRLGLPWG